MTNPQTFVSPTVVLTQSGYPAPSIALFPGTVSVDGGTVVGSVSAPYPDGTPFSILMNGAPAGIGGSLVGGVGVVTGVMPANPNPLTQRALGIQVSVGPVAGTVLGTL